MSGDAPSYEVVLNAPFELYGLSSAWHGPRSIATIGYSGDALNEVALGHGLNDGEHPWVQVGVIGPLHGSVPPGPLSSGGTTEIDASRRVSIFVTTASDPDLTGAAVAEAEKRLRQRWASVTISVDREPLPFRALIDPPHWGAVRGIAPDHALIVCASHVAPDEIAVERLASVEPYIAGSIEPDTDDSA